MLAVVQGTIAIHYQLRPAPYKTASISGPTLYYLVDAQLSIWGTLPHSTPLHTTNVMHIGEWSFPSFFKLVSASSSLAAVLVIFLHPFQPPCPFLPKSDPSILGAKLNYPAPWDVLLMGKALYKLIQVVIFVCPQNIVTAFCREVLWEVMKGAGLFM